MLKLKRAYEARRADDGTRLLVDRLWPRGLSKVGAGIDEWLIDLAPSDGLRKWFAHEPGKWAEFRQRYLQELAAAGKADTLNRIARMAAAGDVTLVYAARDTGRNNAIVLAEAITNLVKEMPPG